MHFIERVCLSYLRNSILPKRFQSKKRPTAPLGSRILLDPDKVFDHNMWDHMQWSQEEEERAKEKATANSLVRVQSELQDKYEREASKYWDQFYKTHKNNFFKDRNWLFLEFPEILPKRKYDDYIKMDTSIEKNSHLTLTRIHEDNCLCENNSLVKGSSVQGSNISSCHHYSGDDHHSVKCFGKQFPGSNAIYRILEVGCGVGNSVIPILKAVCHIPGVFLYCCDFASGAVELIKSHSSFDSSRCFAFVHDLCDNASPYPFPDESLDVILLVFVLSSIHPDRIQGIVNRLAKLLKPGGMMLFRDYGRYDASQLRFKKGCCLSENFYVRGDGTRAYFFTKGVLHP
ncbi:mRNA N(3)-methylcytidine methyltransferase METTL8 isoform X1 [Sceloporus undulatus]|uniref:mRNA N(3)-methylcytidine methyltransferase METTL8 isoform X1 n=2 Tax=Sceloporus undulatus TaxID=8520 RepID=UPI001C4DCB32|nr:mRNA N(3)-methylcytidine methyltransferase METTL8 isoform X1 [Sceloporus undulatus]